VRRGAGAEIARQVAAAAHRRVDPRPARGVELSLATEDEALEAIVCLPVGGQGVVGDGEPFTPPWAA
jgi:hypothetical protein